MNLRKNIKVKTYWVLAKYKVKKENTPMLSILKAVSESMQEVGYINAEILCEDLLYPLTEQAAENLLLRLKAMNYLKEDIQEPDYWEEDFEEDEDEGFEDKDYILTKLGGDAVLNEAYYEERKGVLKIQMTDKDDFILQDIIDITQSGKDIDEDQNAKKLPSFIRNLPKSENIYVLNNGEYILDEIEDKGIIDGVKEEELIIKVDQNGSTAKVLGYENYESFWKVELIKRELLRNEFHRNYIEPENVVRVPYDKNKILFSRTETISQPQIKSTTFNELKLNINVSPKNSSEAESWYLELLRQRIQHRTHFLSDVEFKNYANDLAKEFILFQEELTNRFSRTNILEAFDSKTDFYIRAKLETIDYLNY